MSEFFSKASLEKQHNEIQEKLKANPELKAKVQTISEMVDKQLAIESDLRFGDDQIERENQLRTWIRTFFDDKTLNISDAESFLNYIKQFKVMHNMEKGNAAYFIYNKKIVTITILDTIELVPTYVERLETQLISHEKTIQSMYNLSFLGYIKLAFKKLFGGN